MCDLLKVTRKGIDFIITLFTCNMERIYRRVIPKAIEVGNHPWQVMMQL